MKDDIESREKQRRVALRLDLDVVSTDMLEFLPYQYAGKPIHIATTTDEFTSVCPMTGLPDFAHMRITYRPSQTIVELKSLKYYLFQFREVGVFYEHLVNKIADDLFAGLQCEMLEVEGKFTPRGGLQTTVTAVRSAADV